MPFADDHAGIWSFVVGLIVLIMVGVGLSLAVDRRQQFSTSSKTIQQDIRDNHSQLEDLVFRHNEKSSRLAAVKSKSAVHRETHEECAAINLRFTALVKTRDRLAGEVDSLETKFSDYRGTFRRKLWARAVGESLGTLKISGGREYRGAVITRVTEVGLEIRHQDGIARIQPPDLSVEIQERFQWDDEERRRKLAEESVHATDPTSSKSNPLPAKPAPVKPASPAKLAAAAKEQEMRLLRTQVVAWQAKVDNLSSDYQEAEFQAQSGGQASVPGGLETWRTKAKRLRGELTRAGTDLVAAEARLAAVAPDDPLLQKEAR